MKFFVFVFLFVNMLASDDYSLRLAYGKVTDSDFGQILSGDIRSYPEDLRVLALDGGYLLRKNMYELPMDVYFKVGLSRFDENGLQDDIYESTFYIKAYWNFDFLDKRVRLGFGEGVSYTSGILSTEYKEAQSQEPAGNNSKILNYIDFSLDFELGKLLGYKPLYGTSLGWAIKHRSGVYGLINGVRRGGSNYNTLYIETNF
ncbi:hypothetical protein KKG72_09820 [bacterium]|nr:hypothetical protein [bacterium]MBU1993876.1 hypothetical protein [bacterium]